MTLLELIAQLEQKIQDSGSFPSATTLSDPVTNQADPLVNLATTNLAGLVKLYDRLEYIQSRLFAMDAEGSDLDLVAQLMGTMRALDQQSKVPIIVFGRNGAVLPAGSTLTSGTGVEWVTTEDAVICNNRKGWTNACSPSGRYDLSNGELRLQDIIVGVDSATNSASPVLGGEYETDESLRNRLLGMRPQWQTKGTQSAIEYELEQLNGVLDAQAIATLPSCFNDPCQKHMIAVLGGDENEIANTIFEQIPFSIDKLVGGTTVSLDCDDIKFQRMCPVLVKVKYWLTCDCPNKLGQDSINRQIADYLNSISLSNRNIGVGNVASISKDIVKVEFTVIPKLIGDIEQDCLTNDDIIDTFDNPITGEQDELYGTDDPNSFCWLGDPECQDPQDCLNLKRWMYAVFLPENIEKGTGCPCETDDGCGCANG